MCAVDGCNFVGKLVKGYCQNHYRRFRKYGSPVAPTPPRKMPPRQPCIVHDCENLRHSNGYCSKHFYRFKRNGDATKLYRVMSEPGDTCQVIFEDAVNCQEPFYSLGYCQAHYNSFKRHGDPLYEWVKPERLQTQYISVTAIGHPNAGKKGRILQHRLVMSEALGRPLKRHENIHHKNGNRHDNRIENLELWSVKQPQGQRVTDKVNWALEILALYAPDKLKES